MPRVVPSSLLALAVAFSAGLTAAGAQRATPAAPVAPTVIPLTVLRGHVRTVRVVVARDTFDFMFDTGNGTIVIAPEVATALGCAPAGRALGFRMTGERVGGPFCDDVPLVVEGVPVHGRAQVVEMAKIMGGPTKLAGVIGLTPFADRTITLDLPGNRLVLETEASAAARTRTMRAVPTRLATGEGGGNLTVFLGMPAPGATLWMEWDSGHNAATFVAPYAAKMLGVADSVTRTELALPIAGGSRAPVIVKDIIHDGVLSAGFLERATWTVDLARSRAWVSAIAPLRSLPDSPVPNVVAPSADVAGTYELITVDGGREEAGVLSIWREGGVLRGALRGVGQDESADVRDIRFESGHLRFDMVFNQAYRVDLAFDGVAGVGTWGDPSKRGGAARAVKRA